MRRKFEINLATIENRKVKQNDKFSKSDGDGDSSNTSPFSTPDSSTSTSNYSSSRSGDTSPFTSAASAPDLRSNRSDPFSSRSDSLSPATVSSPGKFIKISPKPETKNCDRRLSTPPTVRKGVPLYPISPKHIRKRSSSSTITPTPVPESSPESSPESAQLLIIKPKKLEKSQSFGELHIPLILRSKSLHKELALTETTDIKEVVKFIFYFRLRLEGINIDAWSNIFIANLITNFGILCRQSLEDIDNLSLPLALKTEIKSLIQSKQNENYQLKTKSDITKEILMMMRKSWNYLKDDVKLRSIFYEEFYKLLFNRDKKYEKLFKTIEIVGRTSKLFGYIGSILQYIDEEDNREAMFKMATVNLIHNMNEENNNNYAQILAETFSNILDSSFINKQIKDAWYIAAKEFGNALLKQYNVIRNGKKYYVYYMKENKWRKCFCIITHEKIIFNRYPRNIEYNTVLLSDITTTEIIEPNDTRFRKQTNYCLKIGLPDTDNYICAEKPDIIHNIYMDIKIRVEAYNT